MTAELETREKKIIELLLKGPKTAENLAKELSVSRRTILRILPSLEEKLKERGLFLQRKAGKGIEIKGNENAINEIIKEIVQKGSTSGKFSAKERQLMVLLNLLEKKNVEKLYTFAKELGVTEATISYDLNQLEGFLEKYDLKVIRRPGFGVYLEGDEKNKRALLADLIYEQFDETELIELLRSKFGDVEKKEQKDNNGIIDEVKLRLLKFIERDLINKIEGVLKEITDSFELNLADSAFAGLLVHIVLSIARLRNGEKISMEKNILSTLKMTKEFRIAEELGRRMKEKGIFEIPEEELGFITMHLLGAKLRAGEGFDEIFYFINDDEALTIAKEIFLNVGKILKREIYKDEKAIKDLALHLKPAIARLRLKMEIRNPLINQLKEKYNDLMDVCKRAVEPLENKLLIKFPESELGFIAMHVGASLERMKKEKEYNVILVCPTGISSSKMLLSRVEKELPNLKVLDAISILELEKALKKYGRVDFIISTIPVEIPNIKSVTVSPLLDKKDLEKINVLLKEFEGDEGGNIDIGIQYSSKSKKEDSKDALFDIIEGTVFLKNMEQSTIEGVIEEIIKNIRDLIKDEDLLKKDLKKRMDLSGCGVPGKGVFLLHARSSAVSKPFFGVFGTKKEILLKNMDGQFENYKDFALMLLPQENYKKAAELFGKISVLILEDQEFLKALKGESESLLIKTLIKKLK